jgi:hypothetical protein
MWATSADLMSIYFTTNKNTKTLSKVSTEVRLEANAEIAK